MRRCLLLTPQEADHALKCRRQGCVCSVCVLVRAKFASRRPLRIVVVDRG